MSKKLISTAITVLTVVLGLWLWSAAQAPAPRYVAVRASVSSRQLDMDRGAAAVWQSLKKLHTRASLLMIVAHPDDEDGGLLAYESRGQGVRAALLTLNRGEGGENLMSSDFYDALGLVRTEELLAADQYYGTQQYFTRVVDFGFSKTQAETFQQWGRERLLADAVRVVRTVRPLVLTSVFVGGPSDGHGNHAASGEISQEVYTAAGDPKMFPDQIAAGLRPWNPLKVYARVPVGAFTPQGIYDSASQVYTPGRIFDYVHQSWIEGQPSITLRVPEGGYDPVLGASYLQIARLGLGQQRSQNGGTSLPDAGPSSTPYHLYAARVKTGATENSYFDGVDVSLMGIASLAAGPDDPAAGQAALRAALGQINTLVEQAMRDYSAADPAKIAPTLAQGLSATNALIEQVRGGGLSAQAKYDVLHELEVKQAQFNNAIVEALGLSLTARVASAGGRGGPGATFTAAIPGQRFAVQTHFDNPSADPVTLDAVTLAGLAPAPPPAAAPATLADNQVSDARLDVSVPLNAPDTRPYFTRPNTEQAYYDLADPRYATLPFAPYPLSAWAHLHYRGVPLELGQVVQTVERISGPGVVENPLVVAPAISVEISPRAGIVPLPATAFQLTATIHSNVKGAAAGTVRLRLPSGWTATPAVADFSVAHDGEDQPISFRVQPARAAAQLYTLTAVASYNGRDYEEGYHTAGYIGVRPYNDYAPATYLTRGVQVGIAPALNVAYVAGTGDDVPQSLENLGVHVHFLAAADLASGNLSSYSAIVLGIRAYAARPDLRAYNGRLLDYVQQGGVLIAQYGTSEFNHNYGPYPYQISGNGATVVDETSAVRLLAPDDPVLSTPNRITAADFQGWVEERGHGFLTSWDPRYQPLLEMHDPDQAPQEGGLLYARYGKGAYVYEGIALYRQLAEGVPGAYRLFANLLSLKP